MSTNLTVKEHLRAVAEASRNFANSLVGKLAQTVTDAMTELESVKADKPETVAITIPTTGWETDATVPGYTKYIDISVSGLLETDRVGVDVDPTSTAVARAANFTNTESFAGVLRLRAAAVPTAAIKAEYHIVGTQAAATQTAAAEKEV